MIRLLKFFLKSCILAFVFFVAIDYFFLREKKVDLSDKTDFKKLIGATFEMKQDTFLYKQYEDQNFHLGISQEKTWLPENTEEYLNDLKRGESTPNYVWHQERFQAIHLLPPGTQFRITGIFRFEKPLVGDYLAIEIVILNGPYEGRHAQAQGLFNYNVEPYEVIGPNASLYQVI